MVGSTIGGVSFGVLLKYRYVASEERIAITSPETVRTAAGQKLVVFPSQRSRVFLNTYGPLSQTQTEVVTASSAHQRRRLILVVINAMNT